jgi:F-type H+-transporting ATPase subunit b
VTSLLTTLVLQAQEVAAEEPVEHLSPKLQELVVGAIAFAVLFLFMARWVFPRVNQLLEARRERIQGDLERAERARREADELLARYREQLAGAREEANRIIEEARQRAEEVRRDLLARAEQERQEILNRTREEVAAERERVFQELRAQVGELSVELAARVIGEALVDRDRHLRLVDDYLRQLEAVTPSGNGRGEDR